MEPCSDHVVSFISAVSTPPAQAAQQQGGVQDEVITFHAEHLRQSSAVGGTRYEEHQHCLVTANYRQHTAEDMSLPGLSLPGLRATPSTSTPLPGAQSTSAPPRTETLQPKQEWRFEVSFSQKYHIKVEHGHAELFGVELAQKQLYTFSGCKGAILSWQGCQLEISGNAESEYAGQETEYADEWLNVHGWLSNLRVQSSGDGPRVLVVGPDFAGKSSLVRSLAAWGVRTGHSPTILNLDPREGLLAPPGSLTAVTCDSQMDVETGYGIGPMSGPTVSPIRTPLIYSFPFASPTESPSVFKALITRMALSVTSRLEDSAPIKRSGLIIDTPGTLNDPKSSYDLITHIISEFSINMVLTLGSERLTADLTRKLSTQKDDDPITVLRITKPSGAVERDSTFLKTLRTQQLRHYVFGSATETLAPHTHTIKFDNVDLFRVKSGTASVPDETSFGGAGDDDDDDYDVPYANSKPTSKATFEKITPSAAMTGGMVAIKFCPGSSDEQTVRDSAVMGFAYVSEVNEAKRNVRFLAPHPQQWGNRALVWGHGWPEAVADLVA
ncbi:mRNA cleavage and polyadenylation factor CLP1 [Fulvia fulva]|uniref:Polynucleotide 5'-hydroxyl-kinase GRC3 n=1 Tax=Passalora fulva TaxID=5499 RepID=A0A9Q8PDZ0_PASFU|nr:mRNA cleavage and polyadenylation factor CLP1 [Fulvia fulva]UJO20671.1 mRNA cleavage and polyadenylation factor CLP1 [Fulvia fulva]WPV18414.1 mRNA cleavage and polyadenylation factor CLP1 [Fulvia fulva]WPV32882.1 mRNA cleavage and polyadenylation factor CLP1 [Fulvia fulva]